MLEMIEGKGVTKHILSIISAIFIGAIFSLGVQSPDSSTESVFFFSTIYSFILTDYIFVEKKDGKFFFLKESITRLIALIIPVSIIAIFFYPFAATGIAIIYILLGFFEVFLLNKKLEPKSKFGKQKKITILVLSIVGTMLLIAIGIGVGYITGFFNGLENIQNTPPLMPGSTLTRQQWILQYTFLGIALYFIQIQKNTSNKFAIDFVTGVHFIHMFFSSIWPFTLAALKSSVIAISTAIFMTGFLFLFAYLTRKISTRALYFILPNLVGRLINLYLLIGIVILNPDRWDLL